MTGSTIFVCLRLRYRDLTSIWRRCLALSLHDEILEPSVCHCLEYERLSDRADCPVDHVEIFHGVEVDFCGNLEPPYLSTVMCSSGLHHPSQAQLSYVLSMVHHHGQEQIIRVSEVRVAVNDWVNDPLVLRAAEVSRLDEHLVKVPSSVFA